MEAVGPELFATIDECEEKLFSKYQKRDIIPNLALQN